MLDLPRHEAQDQPCLFIRTYTLHNGGLQTHVHDGFEMGVTLAGRGALVYKDSRIEVEPGDAYFLDGSIPHAHDSGVGGFLYGLAVNITNESTESLAPPDRLTDLIRPFYLTKSEMVPPTLKGATEVTRNLSSALAAFESRDPYGYFAAWPHVINAVININREINRRGCPEPHPLDHRWTVILNKAVDFIHKNYLTDISLQDIAEHCCISVSGLSQLFKTRIRTSPIKFRNRLRINWGIMLLETTDYTIERIAYDCGFNDVSSFRRMLFARTRRSPHEIRSGMGGGHPEWGCYS